MKIAKACVRSLITEIVEKESPSLRKLRLALHTTPAEDDEETSTLYSDDDYDGSSSDDDRSTSSDSDDDTFNEDGSEPFVIVDLGAIQEQLQNIECNADLKLH